MKCKCDSNMIILSKEYNNYDDILGTYYYCNYCGRAFYFDSSKREPDTTHWITPEYLKLKSLNKEKVLEETFFKEKINFCSNCTSKENLSTRDIGVNKRNITMCANCWEIFDLPLYKR